MKKMMSIYYPVIWKGIKSFARKAGRVSARPLLLLYFVLRNDSTPKKDKVMIYTTLAYLVLPLDFLKAIELPGIGWLDEIASVAVAIKTVYVNITPEIEKKVDGILDSWFCEYTEFEDVPAEPVELRQDRACLMA